MTFEEKKDELALMVGGELYAIFEEHFLYKPLKTETYYKFKRLSQQYLEQLRTSGQIQSYYMIPGHEEERELLIRIYPICPIIIRSDDEADARDSIGIRVAISQNSRIEREW